MWDIAPVGRRLRRTQQVPVGMQQPQVVQSAAPFSALTAQPAVLGQPPAIPPPQQQPPSAQQAAQMPQFAVQAPMAMQPLVSAQVAAPPARSATMLPPVASQAVRGSAAPERQAVEMGHEWVVEPWQS